MQTRRYPRTMQEAFGPYTDRHVYPIKQERRHPVMSTVLVLVLFALLGLLLAWRG
jgi:hypothetical protein